MTSAPGGVLAGVERAVEAVAGRLEVAVPAELALLETVYGRPVQLDDGGPDLWRPPGLYARGNRARIEPDDYPAVLVVPQADSAQILEPVDGGPTYRIRYVLRVWAFCRFYGYEDVAACRNRLALAIVQGVLRRPRLADGLAFDPTAWRSSYSDIEAAEDESSHAGWWGEFIVVSDEALPGAQVARADTIGLAVHHPEAD